MAEHVLETKILLRYGTFNQWRNSNIILKAGEPGIAIFPSNRSIMQSRSDIAPENTPPAVGIKIGNGIDRFDDLPWVQAIAADVYSWAKSPEPPSYTADDIDGLEAFIDEHTSGGSGAGSGTTPTVSRRYQIYRGTGNNIDKYYLRYRDGDEGNWIVDYNYSIDLSNLAKLLDWIGTDLDEFYSLGYRTDQHILTRRAELVYPTQDNPVEIDQPTNHYVITDITQTDGLIHAKKSRLVFDDISDTLAVEKGGTGVTYVEPGEVLVGNGENAIQSIAVASSLENTRTLVYNFAIKSYIDSAVAGLTGAMHYRGEASVEVTGAVNPQVPDYDFRNVLPGDVVTYGTKEYVWNGASWRLLGDEGSYAVKGSIRDGDIDSEAAIQMSKIAGLIATLDTKVDKEDNKGLSTHDYDDEAYTKMEGIEDGAQANRIEHIYYNDSEVYPITINGVSKIVDLHVKEFDDDARAKLNRLDSIEDGAQVNKIEHITVDGTEVGIGANKTIALTTDPHTEHENVIEEIYINERQYYPDQHKAVHITLDESALQLHILEGATVPLTSNTREEVAIDNKKLLLERVAKTGLISDLLQEFNTHIILDCGTSMNDTH